MEDKQWTYDDIINLPHHESQVHQRMSRLDRAAQFSPFAALTGYGDVIQETARQTMAKEELDETKVLELDQTLSTILESLPAPVPVHVRYFKKDTMKEGGEYIEINSNVRKADMLERIILLDDGLVLNLENIYELKLINS